MPGVLEGIRVVDLTRVLAGPWCTQLLADYGAEVLKVESPKGGDDARKIPPFFTDESASAGEQKQPISAFFACCNRGKSSVIVDIRTAEGQAQIREMVAVADIFVENFKVGNLAKYELDYATLSEINPSLIYCSITGYGQTGPMASYPGYDLLFQGISGAMSTCGLPDGQPGGGPMRTIVPHTDLMSGMYACNAILAAVMHRQQTEEGQYIDVALLDVAIAANAYVGSGYLASGKSPQRVGNSGVAASPSDVYRCRDGWVIVQCNDGHWRIFCEKLDKPEWLEDPRFATLHSRIQHAAAIDELILGVTAGFAKADFVALIAPAGVPCVPVNEIGEAFAEPQVIDREMVGEMTLSDGRSIKVVRNPVRFSTIELKRTAPPLFGES
jgi:crotonobetainyl-CoA:carnitine CoA-transferase CaiB-like acyl-CoA transferase